MKIDNRKNNRGFTLVEIIAVIVILGLLMAIGIPMVTKYITQSRKNTIITTMENYIGSVEAEVNSKQYSFKQNNRIYAVPIECVPLERGGEDPFGDWHQVNDDYWAYVLVQYDDEKSSYIYGFTFKDNAGYGLYPTTREELEGKGTQVRMNLNLNRPTNGNISNLTDKENWLGFKVDNDTQLSVLDAESENVEGDGRTTCTLHNKGDNYADVEAEKQERGRLLSEMIKGKGYKSEKPNLTTTSKEAVENGLYISYATNNGKATYYFRGKADNYVQFAGFMWRVIRINEDGSIRLILNSSAGKSAFHSSVAEMNSMYYSNTATSGVKKAVDAWYDTNIKNNYDSYVVKTMFCEQAKVLDPLYSDDALYGGIKFRDYKNPNFKCQKDTNGKGILELKVGLISFDEALHAGGYPTVENDVYYLKTTFPYWTMSAAGYNKNEGAKYYRTWYIHPGGGIQNASIGSGSANFAPVINLSPYVRAVGEGTSAKPYVIKGM